MSWVPGYCIPQSVGHLKVEYSLCHLPNLKGRPFQFTKCPEFCFPHINPIISATFKFIKTAEHAFQNSWLTAS